MKIVNYCSTINDYQLSLKYFCAFLLNMSIIHIIEGEKMNFGGISSWLTYRLWFPCDWANPTATHIRILCSHTSPPCISSTSHTSDCINITPLLPVHYFMWHMYTLKCPSTQYVYTESFFKERLLVKETKSSFNQPHRNMCGLWCCRW